MELISSRSLGLLKVNVFQLTRGQKSGCLEWVKLVFTRIFYLLYQTKFLTQGFCQHRKLELGEIPAGKWLHTCCQEDITATKVKVPELETAIYFYSLSIWVFCGGVLL